MWQNFKKDGVVSERACRLTQVVITPTHHDSADITLYDGVGTNGRLIATIRCAEHDTKAFSFNPAIPCSEGLYLDVGSDIENVLVGWECLDPKPTEWEGAVAE